MKGTMWCSFPARPALWARSPADRQAEGPHRDGSAGPEKTGFLKEIGVDHAIDSKAESDSTAALLRAARTGFDVYF